jgi:hypothetical protein
MTWIPTSKQLPPDGEVVETKTGSSNRTVVELKFVNGWWYTPITNTLLLHPPTHWRKKELNNERNKTAKEQR